jgi:hypothetical protein
LAQDTERRKTKQQKEQKPQRRKLRKRATRTPPNTSLNQLIFN